MKYKKIAEASPLEIKFVETANEFAEKEYFDDEDTTNELLFLAKLGQKVFDQERIRNCYECNKIYFAQRIEAKCCSKKCSNAWHQREWRERQKESA